MVRYNECYDFSDVEGCKAKTRQRQGKGMILPKSGFVSLFFSFVQMVQHMSAANNLQTCNSALKFSK